MEAKELERVGLSIVVPTYNRRQSLERLLTALGEQIAADDAERDVEVIVIDDGSTDSTTSFLQGHRPRHHFRFATQANQGQAAALNHGLRLANGPICLFLDDDIVPGATLVRAHRAAQAGSDEAIVVGRLEPATKNVSDWLAHSFAERWHVHQARLASGEIAPVFTDCYSGNLSVPTAVALGLGGFRADFRRAFDIELAASLTERGLPVIFASDAIGYHHDEKTGLDLLRDAELEGAAAAEIARRHPAALPTLRLGGFGEGGPRAVLLRRLLLALRVPSRALARAGGFVRGRRRLGWFRFVHAYAYWKGVRSSVDGRTWTQLTKGVTVLMYHAIGWPDERPSRYVVPIGRFRRQMAWLRMLRYQVITVEQLLVWRSAGRLPPPRSIAVTFDDGYADNLALAAPVLERVGARATLYLVAGSDDRNDWDRDGELAARSLVGKHDIPARSAFELGVHSMTHQALVGLTDDALDREVVEARSVIEHLADRSVATFAYPYGKADEAARAAVERAGYIGACGVRDGPVWPATPTFELNRTEVWGTDSLVRFALAIATGYGRWPRRRGTDS